MKRELITGKEFAEAMTQFETELKDGLKSCDKHRGDNEINFFPVFSTASDGGRYLSAMEVQGFTQTYDTKSLAGVMAAFDRIKHHLDSFEFREEGIYKLIP